MKIILLLLSLFILYMNLISWKNIFRTSEKYQKQMDLAKREQLKGLDEDEAKGIIIIVGVVMVVLQIVFYVFAANFFWGSLIMIYPVFRILRVIASYIRAINQLIEYKFRENFLGKIITVTDTVFIIYFIYHFVIK